MKRNVMPFLAWLAAGLVVILVAGLIGGYLWLDRFLRSEDCRKILANLIGQEMRVVGHLQPLSWSGFSVYSTGFAGSREGDGPIASTKLDRIRAELRLASLFRGVWEIPEITVERLDLDLTPPPRRVDGTLPEPPPPLAPVIEPSPMLALLPRRVHVGRVICRDATVIWPSGREETARLVGAKVTAEPDGQTWTFKVEGGRLVAPGFPEVTVHDGLVRLKVGDFLFLDAVLRDGTGGKAELRGKVELSGAGRLELNTTFRNFDVSPFLDADWRRRFSGRAEGELQVSGTTGEGESLRVQGPVRLREARLEALPILNSVALLTQTQEFRTIKFQKAEGRVERRPPHLQVTEMNVESELLLKILGTIRTKGTAVSGELMVGTTPRTLRVIPGATEKVFTTAQDGYVWTPVTVGGTVDEPTEDLTPRLREAAVGTVIEAVPAKVKEKAGELLDNLGRALGF